MLPSIVQILLGYILIPILAGILGLFSKSDDPMHLVNLVITAASEIPVLGTMTDAIMLCLTNMGSEFSRLQMIESIALLSFWDLVAASSIGMWTGICFKLGKLIGIKGLPVLQSLAAVVITCSLSWFQSAYADTLYLLMLFAFSLTLNTVLTFLVADRKFLAVLWGMGCEGVAGTFATAYAAFLIIAMQGLIPNLGIWILIQLCLIVPMTLFLVVDLLWV